MSIVRVETERLIVREFQDGDQAARRALIVDAFGHPLSEADNNQWFTWTQLNYRALERLYQPPYGEYAVVGKATGTLIGSVGLVQSLIPWGVFDQYRAPDEPPYYLTSPEFGLFWAVDKTQRGQGYAAEAAQAIIDYAFQKLAARRVIATTEQVNAASQRVMRKLGMTVLRNPGDQPFWFEVVGVLNNPLHPDD